MQSLQQTSAVNRLARLTIGNTFIVCDYKYDKIDLSMISFGDLHREWNLGTVSRGYPKSVSCDMEGESIFEI